MITMLAPPGTQFTGPTGLTYIADANGHVHFVRTSDVDTLRAAGARPHVLAATKALKVHPHQRLYFSGGSHMADANGLILDVPHDEAVVLIRNGVATEANEADFVTPDIDAAVDLLAPESGPAPQPDETPGKPDPVADPAPVAEPEADHEPEPIAEPDPADEPEAEEPDVGEQTAEDEPESTPTPFQKD